MADAAESVVRADASGKQEIVSLEEVKADGDTVTFEKSNETKAEGEIKEVEQPEEEQINSDQKNHELEKKEDDESHENANKPVTKENDAVTENTETETNLEEDENKEQVGSEKIIERKEENKELEKKVKLVDETILDQEPKEELETEEHVGEKQTAPTEAVTEEDIYEEFEEEIENEEGVKFMKKIKRKITPIETVKEAEKVIEEQAVEAIEEEEQPEPERKQSAPTEGVTEEGIYEEIEEEVENEEGVKITKKIKKKITPIETVKEAEEVVEEQAVEEPPLPDKEVVEEEQVMEEPPPDPAAPLDFSDSKEAIKPPFHLRPDQYAELESLWDLFQNYTPVYTDIDGYITEKELVYMLKALLLMTYTEDQLHELINFVCRPPHPKGHITYEQFVKMVTLRQRDLAVEDELRNAMKVMDFDNTGVVDREFFRDTLLTRGSRMTHKMVDFLIKEVDITNDGELGIEDVVGTIAIDLNREDLDMLRKSLYPDEDASEKEDEENEDGNQNATAEENDEEDEDDD